jgi:hypothetical protein
MWNQHEVNLPFKALYNCSSPKSLDMFSISKKKKRKEEHKNKYDLTNLNLYRFLFKKKRVRHNQSPLSS